MIRSSQVSILLRHFCKRSFTNSAVLYNETALNSIPIQKTRNIGIIAHIDAGKTTTTERMLYFSGRINKIGNVDEGDTVTDYLPAERDRGITIQSAATTIPWNSHKINIIDTPGHADFTFEVIRSLRVLDGAVTILDAVAGVEAQTEKVWKQASDLKIPKICYINKMDRDGAGFSRTVKEIVQKLQTRVIMCNIPYFVGGDDRRFVGVIDILHKKILKWDSNDETGRDIEVIDIEKGVTPDEIYEMVYKSREAMVETLGEVDDKVIDSFFETEDYMAVPVDVLNSAIKKSTLNNHAVAVFCGSSFKNIGVQPLMDAINLYLPSPLEIPVPEVTSESTNFNKSKKRKRQKISEDSPLKEVEVPVEMDNKKGLVICKNPNLSTALAFKVITHPIRGPMVFIRVYAGTLKSGNTFINTRTGKQFKLGKLLLMHGDVPENVSKLSSGNIGVITGMGDELKTGDTIVVVQGTKSFPPLIANLKMMPIEIPPPVFSVSVEPITAGDKRYLEECIQILLREDPSLHVNVDQETGQTVLSGMGELHLEILGDRLVKDLKAKCELGKVVVTYKETLTCPTEQITMKGSEDEVSITLSLDSFEGPIEENGLNGLELEDNNMVIFENGFLNDNMKEILDGRRWKSEYTPESLHDSIIQGCISPLQSGGPLARLPFHSTIVRIHDWKFPVESTNGNPSSLLTATRLAINQAITKSWSQSKYNFTLTEPIMDVNFYVNSDTMGEVIQDLNSQRNAIIHAIEDESENLDNVSWAAQIADEMYVPPDYTMKSNANLDVDLTNKKKIVAQAPLKEMIGYLSRLRSITQGRGNFDMTYNGMQRTTRDRCETILSEF